MSCCAALVPLLLLLLSLILSSAAMTQVLLLEKISQSAVNAFVKEGFQVRSGGWRCCATLRPPCWIEACRYRSPP
jgi:hypothetical protein